jgi:NAD-dependent deacetylase
MSEAYEKAAKVLAATKNAIAVTGAGISVESGIPDFRSPGGLWTRYPPDEYATVEAFHDDPDKVWVMFYELGEILMKAEPNPAHFALASLEEMGCIQAVITQNIDALHQEAGNSTVIEYHGNAATLICPACHRRSAMSLDQRSLGAPRCVCGGYLKPDVVLFGDPIPPNALFTSDMLAQKCEALIVVGTSAQVYPAASLPVIAKECGAFIIECNLEPTSFTNSITDAFLHGPAGKTLPRLVERVAELRGSAS